jgi:hypothetical protein
MPNIDPNIVINFLNELVKVDKEAVKNLVETRVPCSEKLTEHPTVQVLVDENGQNPKIGIMGILNGLIGVHESGYGYIAAVYNDYDGFEGFEIPPQVRSDEK